MQNKVYTPMYKNKIVNAKKCLNIEIIFLNFFSAWGSGSQKGYVVGGAWNNERGCIIY